MIDGLWVCAPSNCILILDTVCNGYGDYVPIDELIKIKESIMKVITNIIGKDRVTIDIAVTPVFD